MSALDKSCSLHQLVHYQAKLQALQQHVLQGTTLAAREAMCSCPALIKVMHTSGVEGVDMHALLVQCVLQWLPACIFAVHTNKP